MGKFPAGGADASFVEAKIEELKSLVANVGRAAGEKAIQIDKNVESIKDNKALLSGSELYPATVNR